jgi:hypothetical protein
MASNEDHLRGGYLGSLDCSGSWETMSQGLDDSESGDTWETETISPCAPPRAKMTGSRKPSKPRRVTIHTPSEEALHQRFADLRGRRPPTPYAYSRHPVPREDNGRANRSPKRDHSATPAPSTAPAGAAPPPLGQNQPCSYAVQGQPFVPGQPFIAHQPFLQTHPAINFAPPSLPVNQPGQSPSGSSSNDTAMSDGYQNAFPPNRGIHFQPQVPDTSLGPMTHVYQPRFDNGSVPFAQPGIIVCRPSPFVSVPPAPLTALLTAPNPAFPTRHFRSAATRRCASRHAGPAYFNCKGPGVYDPGLQERGRHCCPPRDCCETRLAPHYPSSSKTSSVVGRRAAAIVCLSMIANSVLPHRFPRTTRPICTMVRSPPPSYLSLRSSPTRHSR